MQRRRKFSKEFKEEAVHLASEPSISTRQVASEIGVNVSTLRRWCKESQDQGKTAFRGQGHARDEEVATLKRELARVRKERDFLKDAAAFFASELK